MPAGYTLKEVDWKQAEASLRQIREQVFMREQNVPEELEWDGLDENCMHILVQDKAGKAVATARMLADGHIGRMAVLAEHRHKGIATSILQHLLRRCREKNLQPYLSAQTQALDFYRKQGFTVNSDVYLDANIPHVDMILENQ